MDKKANKAKAAGGKKKLIRTRSETNRLKIIITIAVLLVASLVYYLIDSGSYVATVDGNRIATYEYRFFLSRQQLDVEQKQELTAKTNAEKQAFWTTTADGQNPWETAKREALNASKDYMIQLIKAGEMGLKVDANIKNEVSGILETTKSNNGLTDKLLNDYIRGLYRINTDEFRRVTENLMLIDRFKAEYLKKNYTAPVLADKDIEAYYKKDTKQFDKVDIRYASFKKLDDKYSPLPQEKIDEKKKKAQQALEKIRKGEDVDKVIKEYSEEAAGAAATDAIGRTTLTYDYIIPNMTEWVFANKPGDSEIIETDSVIYVVKIEKRTGFEDVKASVKSKMEEEAREKFYDEALSAWSHETRYNVVQNNRVYDSISYSPLGQ